jgi:predicted Zn-dependent protease
MHGVWTKGLRRKEEAAAALLFTAFLALVLASCATNPLTGKSHMAFVDNSELFPASFQEYRSFLSESNIITGTADAQMVDRVGRNIKRAAEVWFSSLGQSDYLSGYEWEYHLVESSEINAWCMPGGKIVFYTGILPLTQNEHGMAVVMGHEVAHALLNHGQQNMSAGILQEVGAGVLTGVLANSSQTTQTLSILAYTTGTSVLGTLPFSRAHESEADHYGLILAAIAGYNVDEAVPFWQRMSALGGGTVEFLSTHPSDQRRIGQLQGWIPEAKQKAAELGGK